MTAVTSTALIKVRTKMAKPAGFPRSLAAQVYSPPVIG
jgi:hypothetical protein